LQGIWTVNEQRCKDAEEILVLRKELKLELFYRIGNATDFEGLDQILEELDAKTQFDGEWHYFNSGD